MSCPSPSATGRGCRGPRGRRARRTAGLRTASEWPAPRERAQRARDQLALVEQHVEPPAHVAEELRQRGRLGIEGPEDHPLVAVHLGHAHQAQALAVQLLVIQLLVARHAAERSPVVVGPPVIRAGEGGGTALVGPTDAVAAVAAAIDEGVHLAVGIASDQDRLLTHVRGDEVARLGNLAVVGQVSHERANTCSSSSSARARAMARAMEEREANMGEGAIPGHSRYGQVNAFINSCRHRGNRGCLADQGRPRRLPLSRVASTGERSAAQSQATELSARSWTGERWGLVRPARDSYKGMIFGTFDPEAPPLAEFLATRWGLDMLFDQGELVARPLFALSRRGPFTPRSPSRRVLPDALAGLDILGAIADGLGQDTRFRHPARRATESASGKPAALVLVPTRELALQVAEDLRPIAEAKRLRVAIVYGGGRSARRSGARAPPHRASPPPAAARPDRAPRPRRSSRVRSTRARRSGPDARHGLQAGVDRILQTVPRNRQTMLFSATLEGAVSELAASYTSNASEFSATAPPGARAGEDRATPSCR